MNRSKGKEVCRRRGQKGKEKEVEKVGEIKEGGTAG